MSYASEQVELLNAAVAQLRKDREEIIDALTALSDMSSLIADTPANAHIKDELTAKIEAAAHAIAMLEFQE